MKLKAKYLAKRYRAILVGFSFLIFNLASLVYFGYCKEEITLTIKVMSSICTIIAKCGGYFAIMLAIYDVIEEAAKFALAVNKVKGTEK